MTFDALYSAWLQLVINRIHEAENTNQIMLEVNSDFCKLFNVDRLTWFAVNNDPTFIVPKGKLD